MAKRRKKKRQKIECEPPPSRETGPFSPTYWIPSIDLPSNIAPVERLPGGRIYTCSICKSVETPILKSEEELLQFVLQHKSSSAGCFPATPPKVEEVNE